jgi:hypothetical protein
MLLARTPSKNECLTTGAANAQSGSRTAQEVLVQPPSVGLIPEKRQSSSAPVFRGAVHMLCVL